MMWYMVLGTFNCEKDRADLDINLARKYFTFLPGTVAVPSSLK